MSAQKNKKGSIVRAAILVIAIGLLGYGGWGLWQRYRATNNPNPSIPTSVVDYSTDTPDETKPHCDDSYSVADKDPRRIDIPKLDISGCIQSVGIDQNNAVAVPSNIHLAGWYVNSVRPGETGLSLIDGHVSGRYSKAIFYGLEKLQSGDTFKIQFGDLSWKEFEVVEQQAVPADKASDAMLKKLSSVDSQLTLITCGGKFDRQSQQYEDRIIIRAKLKSNNETDTIR